MEAIDNNLVSCIIPSYKRTDTLRRAINSVLKQTYKNIEVLIVDDNFNGDEYSEQVRNIVVSFDNPRIRLISQPMHINGAEARNAGVRAAKGEYIAFLDDDDEWLSEKIEKQLRFLKDNPIYDGCSVFYQEFNNNIVVHSCPPYIARDLFYKIFCREVAVLTPTVLLKKGCLINTGIFDNSLKRHQDLQMLLRFTSKYNLGVLPEYLVKIHRDSEINRPNAKSIIEIKKKFFRSVQDLFDSCTSKEKRIIKFAHCYEVLFVALKQKQFVMAIKYFFKAGISIKGYKLLIKRAQYRKYINAEH